MNNDIIMSIEIDPTEIIECGQHVADPDTLSISRRQLASISRGLALLLLLVDEKRLASFRRNTDVSEILRFIDTMSSEVEQFKHLQL